MFSKVKIAAAVKAHKLLISKKRLPNYERQFPGLISVISQLEGLLNQFQADWRQTKHDLTELQMKDCRAMTKLWLMRARNGKQTDVRSYFYKM